MGRIRKFLSVMISICCVAAAVPGVSVLADSTGEKVVTLGADLSAEQKTTMLKYFGIEGQDVRTLTVTNRDERDLLGDFVSLDEIGTRTFSCALVKPTNTGGIQVKTANLTYVTSNMIASALSTCGVDNCQVLAAAPFAVSGTGALTGIIMSYESASGKKLNQKRVRAAAREIITTARFGRRFGPPRATLIINRAKTQILQQKVTNVKEITNVINNVSVDLNVTLSDEEVELLTELLQDLADLDYTEEEVDQIQQNLDRVEENIVEEIAEDEDDEEDEEDILMNTDDSALGDDATFDTTEVMSLSLPLPEEELEAESEADAEFGIESELLAEAESEAEIESDLLVEAESEAEEESESESELESELVSEMTAEDESEAEIESEAADEIAVENDAEDIFFNTDDSLLGDDVTIDMTVPETDQTEAAAEGKDTESSVDEAAAEPDAQEGIPADPSAFLPEAQTEEETLTAQPEEESTSFVLGDDSTEEESTSAEGEASVDPNTQAETAEQETEENIFKDILASVTDDNSAEEPANASAESADAADDSMADDSFETFFEDDDNFDLSASDETAEPVSDDTPAASFTAADLSFSPNGTTVEPDLSTLTISCPSGGMSAGSGSLTVYTSDGSAVTSVSMSGASVSDSSASVSIGSVLASDTSYYVILSSDALRKDGVSLEETSSGSWTFSTSGSDEPEEVVEDDEGWGDDWSDDWGDDWDEDWDW